MSNAKLAKDFEKIVGAGGVMHEESDLHAYSYDSAVLDPQVPALVVQAFQYRTARSYYQAL